MSTTSMNTKDIAFLKSCGATDEQPSVTGLMHLHRIAEDRLRSEVQSANESLEAERAEWTARRAASERHMGYLYMILVAAALLAAWGINDALRLRGYERGCVEIVGGRR